ncbi:DUF3995 domain-containing protein [Cohnella faecalis]|uniref:DUF3995 domain-containing protein n=1 Tax=Cohnella faecalis TaxID=2315694 RepID=UPI001314FD6C|nr:DUF3995 domain-containing protein [Cohnella faecalis]
MKDASLWGGAAILFAVSILHFYWAFGGRWGGRAAIPEKAAGEAVFVPRAPETAAVAVLVAFVGLLLLAQGGLLDAYTPNGFTYWSAVVCGSGFALRAIGEFKYVGFLKRVKGTTFAKLDSWLYSPLCALLSVVFWLAIG